MLPTLVLMTARLRHVSHLNWRAAVSTHTELLSFTNPLPLQKINIYKGQTEREWKMQISSSIADTQSCAHALPVGVEAAEVVAGPVGGADARNRGL